jgi:hypothetical protein
MRLRSALRRLRFLAAALATLAAVTGCSGQGEGELCDHRAANNGDTDCQNGLTCQNPASNVVSSPYGICCPGDLGLAMTSACSANSGLIDANPTPPDAEQEASADAGPDAVDETLEGTADSPAE